MGEFLERDGLDWRIRHVVPSQIKANADSKQLSSRRVRVLKRLCYAENASVTGFLSRGPWCSRKTVYLATLHLSVRSRLVGGKFMSAWFVLRQEYSLPFKNSSHPYAFSFQYGLMKSNRTSNSCPLQFLAEDWLGIRLRYRYAPSSRSSPRFRIAVALAVLFAVVAILIVSSIDMPKTVLRVHHLSSHSIGNHGAGNHRVSGGPDLSHSVSQSTATYVTASFHLASHARARGCQVLRC